MRATEYYESFNNQEYLLYKLKLQTLYKNERVTGILNAKVESNRQISNKNINIPGPNKQIMAPVDVNNYSTLQPTTAGLSKVNSALPMKGLPIAGMNMNSYATNPEPKRPLTSRANNEGQGRDISIFVEELKVKIQDDVARFNEVHEMKKGMMLDNLEKTVANNEVLVKNNLFEQTKDIKDRYLFLLNNIGWLYGKKKY
jgi:hypothetical protein